MRALTALGADLANLGRDEDGVACIREAARLAEEIGDHLGLKLTYVNLTDVLTMLGRARESARLGQQAYEVMRGYGMGSTLLATNRIEALLATGDWDEADELSAAALRGIASSFSYWLLTIRADLEIGRGDFTAARAHLDAARATLPEDHGLGRYDAHLAELALWERRWTDADAAIHDGLARVGRPGLAQIRVQLCATGLRAQAELAALARARRDDAALRVHLDRARDLLTAARRAAAAAAPITPNATAWHLQAVLGLLLATWGWTPA